MPETRSTRAGKRRRRSGNTTTPQAKLQPTSFEVLSNPLLRYPEQKREVLDSGAGAVFPDQDAAERTRIEAVRSRMRGAVFGAKPVPCVARPSPEFCPRDDFSSTSALGKRQRSIAPGAPQHNGHERRTARLWPERIFWRLARCCPHQWVFLRAARPIPVWLSAHFFAAPHNRSGQGSANPVNRSPCTRAVFVTGEW